MRSKYLAFLMLFALGVAHGQAYDSASRYEASYKCQAEKAGGFLHSESGSKLAHFKPSSEDFFITHISHLPTKSYKEWPVFRGIEGEDALKSAFEANVHVKMTHQKGVWTEETGTYYFRESSTDPKSMRHAGNSCKITEISGPDNPAIIECDAIGSGQFLFNVDAGRFTRVKAGSWHYKDEFQSSVLEFGYCEEYYP